MALELRPIKQTLLGQREARPAYHVVEDEFVVGRISQGTYSDKWVWTLYAVSRKGRTGSGGRTTSLDQARANFKKAWKA